MNFCEVRSFFSYRQSIFSLAFRTELQKPNLDDGQLLEILRGKDSQIVALETQVFLWFNYNPINLQSSQIGMLLYGWALRKAEKLWLENYYIHTLSTWSNFKSFFPFRQKIWQKSTTWKSNKSKSFRKKLKHSKIFWR